MASRPRVFRSSVRLSVLLTFTFAGQTYRASPAKAAESFSWEQAVSRARETSGVVRRARAALKTVAAGQVGADIVLPSNPVVAISGGTRREEAGGEHLRGLSLGAHVEQAFEIGGQRSARQGRVAREIDAAKWREAVAISEVTARVRSAYVGAQLAQAQVLAANRRTSLVEQLIASVNTRVQAGASSSVDLELARIEVGRAIRERVGANLALSAAQSDLRILLNLEPGTALVLTSPLAEPNLAGDANAAAPQALGPLLARAREQRSELKMLAASRDALDAEIVQLGREAIPNPTLFLDVQRDLPGQMFLGGGIGLALPVWRRNQGETAIVRAEKDRVVEERSLTEREIDAEVERAWRARAAAAEIAQVMTKEVLPSAEAAVSLITQGWQAGKFDLFRVIQASREASDARRSHLENMGALWEAAIALQRALGNN